MPAASVPPAVSLPAESFLRSVLCAEIGASFKSAELRCGLFGADLELLDSKQCSLNGSLDVAVVCSSAGSLAPEALPAAPVFAADAGSSEAAVVARFDELPFAVHHLVFAAIAQPNSVSSTLSLAVRDANQVLFRCIRSYSSNLSLPTSQASLLAVVSRQVSNQGSTTSWRLQEIVPNASGIVCPEKEDVMIRELYWPEVGVGIQRTSYNKMFGDEVSWLEVFRARPDGAYPSDDEEEDNEDTRSASMPSPSFQCPSLRGNHLRCPDGLQAAAAVDPVAASNGQHEPSEGLLSARSPLSWDSPVATAGADSAAKTQQPYHLNGRDFGPPRARLPGAMPTIQNSKQFVNHTTITGVDVHRQLTAALSELNEHARMNAESRDVEMRLRQENEVLRTACRSHAEELAVLTLRGSEAEESTHVQVAEISQEAGRLSVSLGLSEDRLSKSEILAARLRGEVQAMRQARDAAAAEAAAEASCAEGLRDELEASSIEASQHEAAIQAFLEKPLDDRLALSFGKSWQQLQARFVGEVRAAREARQLAAENEMQVEASRGELALLAQREVSHQAKASGELLALRQQVKQLSSELGVHQAQASDAEANQASWQAERDEILSSLAAASAEAKHWKAEVSATQALAAANQTSWQAERDKLLSSRQLATDLHSELRSAETSFGEQLSVVRSRLIAAEKRNRELLGSLERAVQAAGSPPQASQPSDQKLRLNRSSSPQSDPRTHKTWRQQDWQRIPLTDLDNTLPMPHQWNGEYRLERGLVEEEIQPLSASPGHSGYNACSTDSMVRSNSPPRKSESSDKHFFVAEPVAAQQQHQLLSTPPAASHRESSLRKPSPTALDAWTVAAAEAQQLQTDASLQSTSVGGSRSIENLAELKFGSGSQALELSLGSVVQFEAEETLSLTSNASPAELLKSTAAARRRRAQQARTTQSMEDEYKKFVLESRLKPPPQAAAVAVHQVRADKTPVPRTRASSSPKKHRVVVAAEPRVIPDQQAQAPPFVLGDFGIEESRYLPEMPSEPVVR
eukprot:TRINITY_DN77577_c0_g1_i1.p1 TRINITY_DN77577_c0_g1~~TRINITY_DN77577_c0_g1_i1.p1  ORF type:complete len:1027 (+),score=236.02 TRINITY_DN77577_c0_g1_i1:64-3144(+)